MEAQTIDKAVLEASTTPNYLSAADILNCDDREYIDIIVPEWTKDGKPGVITLRSMNAAEAVAFGDDTEKRSDTYVIAVARSAWDRKGNKLLFSTEQVEMLKMKRNKVFLMLQREVLRLNGWRTADERAAAMEAAKKD